MQQFELLNKQGAPQVPRHVELDGASLRLWHGVMLEPLSEQCLSLLKAELNWTQPSIYVYGKNHAIPRLQAWHGEPDLRYSYSGQCFVTEPWTPTLFNIKQRVEALTGYTFNAALCNCYRNGQDSVGWHADDEPELGARPAIASVSFGVTRKFQLRKKDNYRRRHDMCLNHNSLLLMEPGMQAVWQHQVPKQVQLTGERINLTFRYIYA